MSNDAHDRRFAGSIPELYERHLVPLIFEPYARDLARRLATRPLQRVLEVAAGTGVVTREMARTLPPDTEIVATDLNPAMLQEAARIGTARPVRWEPADVMQLPLPDASVDAVVCQFGVMFFPGKPAAYAEMRRVLRPGGVLLFNVWDRIEHNELADLVTRAMATLFPDDPPRFLARTPHGHGDPASIARDLAAAGFGPPPRIDRVTERSRAPSAGSPAIAYCQGTPLRNEIEARDASRLQQATDLAAQAIAARFGPGPVDAMIQAFVVEATR